MPDLNLIDEGGFEESPAPVAPPAKKQSSGGGGGKTILIIVLVLIIAAAVVFVLNQKGIIKLWGKKRPLIVQLEDETFPQEPIESMAQQPDTAVALLETPPIDEKSDAMKELEEMAAEQTVQTPEDEVAESSSKLSAMKGEFTVQVVAYREKESAIETAKNLECAGYPSFVERIPMKGGNWYAVRIGRYPSRNAAKNAVKNFAEQLQAHYVIDKIRSK